MTEYRRAYLPGATWFFTVNLAERKGNRLLVEQIETLREAFEYVRGRYAFHINAVVVLPDHLHCIWTLPPGDSDFSTRWGLVKGVSPVPSKKASGSRKVAPNGANGGYGSADSGSIGFGIRTTLIATPTTSIGIR